MAVLLLRQAKKSGSIALEGDAKHLFSDVMSSVGVVTGLFIASITGLYILDPLIALVVAGLLIKMGIDVIGKTCRDLMDSSCPEEERAIRNVIENNKRIVEYHDLKTRRSGNAVYADVHLCVEGSSSVSSAHEITETLTSDLEKIIPGIVMNIYVEPCQQTAVGSSEGARTNLDP
jgi:cation diffusion facilitator family transporter